MNHQLYQQRAEAAGLDSSALQALHELARQASEAGAEILRSHYGKLTSVRSKGRVGDLVTEADVAAEAEVLRILRDRGPDIGILAEESGVSGPDQGLQWVVDPLDGTTNFAHGYPFFATSVGLTWKGAPLLGAIAVPYLHQTYHCCPGLGSFLNGEGISVSNCHSLQDSLLVTGFAYDRQQRADNNYAEFCLLTHRTRGVRRGGAAAVDLAFLAAGMLDGYWERGLAPWDMAAGVALVELAGGTVTDYRGQPFELGSGRLVAAGPGLHPTLVAELGDVVPLPGASYGAPDLVAMGS